MTMNREATYQPADYCPKYDYAMHPGVCPECGAEIRVQKLSKITLEALLATGTLGGLKHCIIRQPHPYKTNSFKANPS